MTPADILFYTAFVFDIIIAFVGFKLYRQIKGSNVGKLTLFATLSAFTFGIHHLGEVILADNVLGLTISESIETFAAVFLLAAVYQLYKISNDIFIPESYNMDIKESELLVKKKPGARKKK